MENQISQKDKMSRIKVRIIGKITIALYLIIPYVLFLLAVFQYPYHLFEYLNWLTSDWVNYFSMNIFFLIYWSPVLVTIGGVSYIARMSDISRIPPNSSLYDAITLPTMQYGPLKIIFPEIKEETFEENEI
ncbi:MAG: hypothetical protein ACFFAE_07250 [Candidatus Hodarchaeota archaeon]